MRKLITFLGLTEYQETTYRWGQQEYRTRFFAEAVAAWLKPARAYVLLTPKVKESENWTVLREKLSNHAEVEPVDIPNGQSQDELWQTFRAIDEQVVLTNDELIFDITHSFRLLPFLTLLSIAYLRQVKQIQLLHILYGAYEAREKENGREISPVYEITPLVSLLDWLTAAKIFTQTGDGRDLAELMEHASLQQSGEPNAPQVYNPLKEVAHCVRNVTDNLMLSRIPDLARSVQEMHRELNKGQTRDAIRQWLSPLVPLLDEVRTKYKPFSQRTLEAQVDLIEWYIQHGHLIQALTLAREWIINYHLQQQGRKGYWQNKQARDQAENELNNGLGIDPKVISLWAKVKKYRNDAAHCGFRPNPEPPSEIRNSAEQTLKEIRALLGAWGEA